MTTYRVIIDGKILPGFAPEDVRRQLAALVGKSEETASKLLIGILDPLKRELMKQQASVTSRR